MAAKRRRSTKKEEPKPPNHEGYHHARKTVFTWTLVIALTLVGGAILSELELENEKDGVRRHRGNLDHVSARAPPPPVGGLAARFAPRAPLDATRDPVSRRAARDANLPSRAAQLGRGSDPQVKEDVEAVIAWMERHGDCSEVGPSRAEPTSARLRAPRRPRRASPLARRPARLSPQPSMGSLDWDFRSACFFAVTVMTSVGYGSFAPQTPGGRIFTVAFAIVMLPFFAYALSLISGYVVTALAVMAKKLTRGEDKPEVVLAVSVLVTFLW